MIKLVIGDNGRHGAAIKLTRVGKDDLYQKKKLDQNAAFVCSLKGETEQLTRRFVLQ